MLILLFFALHIYSLYKFINLKEANGLVSLWKNPISFDSLSFIPTIISHYISLFLIGLFFICVGLYCYLKKTKSMVTLHFLHIMYVSGFAISLSIPSSKGIFLAKIFEALTVSFSPYFLMLFFEYFPASSKPNVFKKIRLFIMCIAITISGSILTLILFKLHNYAVFHQLAITGIVFNFTLSVFACIGLIFLHLKLNSAKVKNQLYFLIGSLVISFLPVLLFSLIPEDIFYLPNMPYYYSLNCIIIFPITLAYLLTKQEIIDFKISLKWLFYKLVTTLLLLLLFNTLASFFFNLTRTSYYQLNIFIITILVVNSGIQKALELLKKKKWKNKTDMVQREKQIIFQQLLQGQHIATCARLLIDLIQKTIKVDSAYIIWNKATPIVLAKTESFIDINEVIQQLSNSTNKNYFRINLLHIFPLEVKNGIKGWMIIGEKENAAKVAKEELFLLEKIKLEAIALLTNTESLYNIETEVKKSQKEALTVEKINQLLLIEKEEEKKRLSIFLHDEVLQNIILLSNKFVLLHQEEIIEDEARLEINEMFSNCIYEIREMCNELYPVMVEDLGLEQSVQALKRTLQMNHNIQIQTDFQIYLKMIPKSLSIHMFRIIKELLHNSIKHADSSIICVSIKENHDSLNIHVKDDGKGFEVPNDLSSLSEKNHLGLLSIQKRVNQLNGTLDLYSELNLGTNITITLPIEWSEMNDNKRIISR